MPTLWITRPLPEAVVDAARARFDVTVRASVTPVPQDEMIAALGTYDAIHGQHWGVFLVEIGVLVTVTGTMLTIFYSFAGRGRPDA